MQLAAIITLAVMCSLVAVWLVMLTQPRPTPAEKRQAARDARTVITVSTTNGYRRETLAEEKIRYAALGVQKFPW